MQMQVDREMDPSELCVLRHTAAMDDLESCLQHAMVVYAGGARRDVPPSFVLEALEAEMGTSPDWVSVLPFRPKDFLVVFAWQDQWSRMG